MLLSIDRVLQLLGEGKSLEKIAELSNADVTDVQNVITEARDLLNSTEKAKARKKIIIKKKDLPGSDGPETPEDRTGEEEIFEGAELSAVPLGSSLVIYTDGASKGKPGSINC